MKICFVLLLIFVTQFTTAQQTQKPPLHAKHWLAITGKPLAATAGAKIFEQGGNAIDAACAMLAATCTMWDVLSWGGETQALIYNPKTKKVIAINALGVAPSGATATFFKNKGYSFPPEYGPLAATTPGTPGGLCFMLAKYGSMSLKQILTPAMELASGYPIEAQTANSFERSKKILATWPYSKKVFLPHTDTAKRSAPEAGEMFVQKDLLLTLQKMVAAEQRALKQKKSRYNAIMDAYDVFYKGEVAKEFVRSCQEQGGLITLADLAAWKPIEEEALSINYKGIDVYKMQPWTQGPAMLQALNILENFDLKKMGYNTAQYIHTIYQAMSLSFADRDFYYGDPYISPQIPIKGLLSKAYAKARANQIDSLKNNANIAPGDPYPFENSINPFKKLLFIHNKLNDTTLKNTDGLIPKHDVGRSNNFNELLNKNVVINNDVYTDRLLRGTTSVVAADEQGWVVSITPSGGWNPACIAGSTGVGMSQRLQSFVLDSAINPFNVIAPGKRPRVTLTPMLALKNGRPYLAAAVQGGDTQDQNLLQLFLNITEFGNTVQQACEAPNINSNQLWLSLGGTAIADRQPKPAHITIHKNTTETIKQQLINMGYKLKLDDRTSGPLNAIYFDSKHATFWGGSSNNGEDYGIGW